MATDRRQIRTPFHYEPHQPGFHIKTANNQTVGLVLTEQHAQFICRACNRYDALMQAFDLCRGHVNGTTIQPGNVPLRNLHDLLQDIATDIARNGR